MSSRRLERSTTNRVIGGVCGGLAEYLAVDATLVRVVFVIGGILTGGLLLIGYIVLLIVMPLPDQPAIFATAAGTSVSDAAPPREGDAAASGPTTPALPIDPVARAEEEERRRRVFGYVLIALGIAFLLGNAGAFRLIQWQYVWPLVLVGIGVLLLVQRVRP
jgi:phage shock protein C